MVHCQERGDEMIVGDLSHLHIYEQGGSAQVWFTEMKKFNLFKKSTLQKSSWFNSNLVQPGKRASSDVGYIVLVSDASVLAVDERHMLWCISLACWSTLHHSHDSGWWNVWSGPAALKDSSWLPWCPLPSLSSGVRGKHTQHPGWTGPPPFLPAGG